MRRGLTSFNCAALACGFAFLYAPMVLLVLYSFNASRLVTVWSGFSTRWYFALFDDHQIVDSAWMSLRVGIVSAAFATVLGTLAALVLARFGRFGSRSLFAAMIYAPLVMPEVISGLSLLLIFVALGIDRGFWTVALSHTMLSMCFVTVVVHARLVTIDRSFEEAAMDLGATPGATFRLITLPLAAPALVAGFLLAFTLSLDDLVIASFTAGPGSTTLPMRIYSEVRLGVTPEINAISTLLLGVVAVALVIGALASRGRMVGAN